MKYNTDDNRLNIKPDHNIVVQYCFGEYVGSISINRYKKKVSLISHRSTTYPCYLPVLGDSAGAGRIRLTHCKNTLFFNTANKFGKIFFIKN